MVEASNMLRLKVWAIWFSRNITIDCIYRLELYFAHVHLIRNAELACSVLIQIELATNLKVQKDYKIDDLDVNDPYWYTECVTQSLTTYIVPDIGLGHGHYSF